MKRLVSSGLLAIALVAASDAQAQGILPFSIEARGGLAFPTSDFPTGNGGVGEAENGVGFGVNAAFNFLPGVAVYGGWDRVTFGAGDTLLGGGDAEFIDQGFAVGGKLSLPLGLLVGVSPWVKAGALIRTLDLEGNEGESLFAGEASGRSTGFEVGAGVDIPLGLVLSFTPGVTYRTYKPDFGGESDDAVSYVDVSLGLRARI
jgi:hypothetical protein